MQWAKKGFTIVELLIVVVVIAILAAITIIAYNGIQNRAKISTVRSAASQVGKKALAYAPLNNDLYPLEASYQADLALPAASVQQTYDYYVSDDRKSFCLSVTDTTKSPEVAYAMTQAGQSVAGRCVKNLVTNPSFEGGLTGWGTSLASPLLATDWAAYGGNSLRQTPTSTSSYDSWSSIGGDTGAIRLGMQPGRSYIASGTVRLAAVQTSGNRQVRTYYKTASTGYVVQQSAGAPNQVGAFRQSRTFTLPGDATEAFVRFYNGGYQGGGDTWWDGIMLTEGSTLYVYNDPSTNAAWSWTGTANNSASFGPAVPDQ